MMGRGLTSCQLLGIVSFCLVPSRLPLVSRPRVATRVRRGVTKNRLKLDQLAQGRNRKTPLEAGFLLESS